jgi:hypothetical protein
VWLNRLGTWGVNRIVLRLRIPDLDDSWTSNEWLNGSNDDFLIWQLSSQSDSLTVASWSLLSESDIDGNNIPLWWESGTRLSWADQDFSSFYNSQCNGVSDECALKISIINPLVETNGNTVIPYLEYQLATTRVIPFTRPQIRSQGKSYGFTKTLELAAPLPTTSSAFDFTVLQ